MEFLHRTLANGLDVVAEVHPRALTASLGIFVKTGARDEEASIGGISHFLEHMVFKGTATRNAADINRELDELGAASNAYTSEERTVFHATVLPELQEPTLNLLCDLMAPTLDPHEFETERQVVLEEISMYDDQPPYGGFERAMELYFGDHPLSRRVLGTAETVGAMTVDQMRDYHRERYATGNVCIVGSGKIDFDALCVQAELLTKNWPEGHPPRLFPAVDASFGSHNIEHPPAHQQYWIRLSPGPSRKDNDRYAMRVLTTILGDESGSRLFWELADTGLAEGAVLFSQEYDDYGLVQGYLCCSPEDFEENQTLFEEILKQSVAEVPTEQELQQAVQKICSSMILSAEKSSNRLFTVGSAWINRKKWETADEIVARYRSVTLEDLERVAKKFLSSPSFDLAIGPTA